jgi:phage I-like protein
MTGDPAIDGATSVAATANAVRPFVEGVPFAGLVLTLLGAGATAFADSRRRRWARATREVVRTIDEAKDGDKVDFSDPAVSRVIKAGMSRETRDAVRRIREEGGR